MDISEILRNLKILFVEDEEITKRIIKKMLKEKVGELYVAKNGLQGLEMFEMYRPQIVLTDLKMPVLDGISMIKKIRKIDKECGIIINSEIMEVDHILESIDIGIDKYLIKPIGKQDLEDALKIVIKKMIDRKTFDSQINNEVKFTKEKKLEIERAIKTKISSFFKVNIGKGPRDTKIFIKEDEIAVKIYDVLTNMEKTLLEIEKNQSLVEFNRKVFYKNKYKELEEEVSFVMNKKIKIIRVKVDILNNVDELTFKMC